MCPSAERLVDLVGGRLDAAAERGIEEHIDTCATCRVALAAMIRETHRSKTWQLGRYRVDAQLGVGGMGIVYHAWDPALSRELAIKVVRSPDAELRARLTREAQSMARLNHRNVCQIYDVGMEGDELYIAMELVPGTTLRGWIAETRRDPAQVLPLLADAARGLAAAHAAGLVHRDVKPENILVDRNGRAVVSDFGLARDDSQTRITHKSALAGTPAYMAPEQIEGAVADARSDQYAFAITAHEALTGGKPKPRNRASQALPPRLRNALDRALSEVPADRFATMTELVDAMLPRSGPSRLRTVAIAAAAAAAAALGVGAAWFATRKAAPEVVRQMTPVMIVADAATISIDPSPDAAISEAVTIDAPGLPAKTSVPKAAAAPPASTIPGDVMAIQRAIVAGDSKTCTALFANLPAGAATTAQQLRAQCMMIAGDCEGGKQLALAYWKTFNFNEAQLAKTLDADVSLHCRSGTRAPRDRLLRALYVLADQYNKYTPAECTAAYDDAKQLIDTIKSRGSDDMLDDAAARFRLNAPGCFARAGACADAWRVAKERASSDQARRQLLISAVGRTCADQDQGALTDVEVLWRAILEMSVPRPVEAAWCTTRARLAEAMLEKLGTAFADAQRARDLLGNYARACHAAAKP
jgi:serine/threonine protein kinase